VKLAYTFQDDSTFWVDPHTGLVIDAHRDQKRVAAIALPTGSVVPLIPAVAATYQTTAASSQNAADDARNGSTAISWVGVWVPIILLVLGVVLLAVAAFLWMRRRPATPAGTAGPTGPRSPTGPAGSTGGPAGPAGPAGPGPNPGAGSGPPLTKP
jgi:hypothetical protein